jgi:hypothetical protein
LRERSEWIPVTCCAVRYANRLTERAGRIVTGSNPITPTIPICDPCNPQQHAGARLELPPHLLPLGLDRHRADQLAQDENGRECFLTPCADENGERGESR